MNRITLQIIIAALLVAIILVFMLSSGVPEELLASTVAKDMFVFENHMELSNNLEKYEEIPNVKYTRTNTYYTSLVNKCNIEMIYESDDLVQFHIINRNILKERLFQLEVILKDSKIEQVKFSEVMTVYN